MPSFAPHIWLASAGPDMIALDVAADRYARLGAELAQAARAALSGDRYPATLAPLAQAGLTQPGERGRPLAPLQLAVAKRDALVRYDACLDYGLVTSCVAGLAASRLRLSWYGFQRAIERAAQRRSAAVIDHDETLRIGRHFEAARRWFPSERRCLPDGLALHGLLAQRSLAATLVIGVSTRPFRAHCWVQSGDWLLTDCHDDIAELVPILAIE